MSARELSRFVAPIQRCIGNMVARGVVSVVNAAAKMQGLQVRLLNNEIKDSVEHFEPYGFTSHAHVGAEHVTLFVDGDRSHGLTIVVADRRYRLQALQAGEVALHDDQGQSIVLRRDGIEVDGGGKQITMKNAPRLRVEMPIECTQDIKDRCDSTGKTMSGMRSIYNSHTHPENDSGGPTDQPNQQM